MTIIIMSIITIPTQALLVMMTLVMLVVMKMIMSHDDDDTDSSKFYSRAPGPSLTLGLSE